MKKSMFIVVAIALGIGISSASDTDQWKDLPKDVVLGSLSNIYEPVPFNHSGHVSTAGGCVECHHQHGTVEVQACSECHRFDPSIFKKNVIAGRVKACGACHLASEEPGRVGLKTAYHKACFKCHKTDVGSGVKNLKGCTEMCHVLNTKKKPKEK
ncbi:MAG: class cytochrome family protein [Deltaproteobacteria bacterium]|nr:class cytochrome family protein [Deltaproteobacteria bacterium]